MRLSHFLLWGNGKCLLIWFLFLIILDKLATLGVFSYALLLIKSPATKERVYKLIRIWSLFNQKICTKEIWQVCLFPLPRCIRWYSLGMEQLLIFWTDHSQPQICNHCEIYINSQQWIMEPNYCLWSLPRNWKRWLCQLAKWSADSGWWKLDAHRGLQLL